MTTKNWTAEEIPDQGDRIAIVTGSSSGIGYEAARVLANKNATVIIAVRNLEKGNWAAEKIRKQNEKAHISVMRLDLADLASIGEFADEFKKNYSRLDLLINNAGVMIPPYSKTTDGFELQFGTNHLGHFALTMRLLDLMNQTEGARIVNVSSSAHRFGNLDFDDLTWEKRGYRAWRAYGDSKIANIYFTKELARRLAENGSRVIVTSAHPGWTATELQRNVDYFGIAGLLNTLFAQDVTMGALPTLRAAFDPDAKGGEFYGPGGFMRMWGYPVIEQPSELALDGTIARHLWQVSEELTDLGFGLEAKAASARK
jgi:NAD(P)-dependent dehydrogenase (short-subunit alcohol dehydrogenase family)